MSEHEEIDDVWEELIEKSSASDEKVSTVMGLQRNFIREGSGEYIALKSHDLYDAFTARELTDRYHKPFSEAEVITQDVEDYFDDLLDEMLTLAATSTQKKLTPDTQITRLTPSMLTQKLTRQHTRRQLLLWLLHIETLKGSHRVSFPSGHHAHPVEALVVDGQIAMLMRQKGKPLLDGQLARELPELCKRIRETLTKQRPPEADEEGWQRVLLTRGDVQSEHERRALLELALRFLKQSALTRAEAVHPLESSSCVVDERPWLTLSPLEFFLLADDHVHGQDLPTRVTQHMAESYHARGWLMHHTTPLHPFDALISHTRHTTHTIHSASRATLLGNAASKLIEALGFEAHRTSVCVAVASICSLVVTDKDFISAHDYPIEHFANVMGELFAMWSTSTGPADEEASSQTTAVSDHTQADHRDEGLRVLADGLPGCEAVILCTSSREADHERLSWRALLPDETDAQARAFVSEKSSMRGVYTAIEQFKVVSAEHSQIHEFHVMDQDRVCIVLPFPQRPSVVGVWMCRLNGDFGFIRATVMMNAAQFDVDADA